MKDTMLRNPEQVGRAVRLKRQEKGLSQNTLARDLGVERKWVIRLEAGNAKAEFGLVLAALTALGLSILVRDEGQSEATPKGPSKLDEVFQQLRRSGRK